MLRNGSNTLDAVTEQLYIGKAGQVVVAGGRGLTQAMGGIHGLIRLSEDHQKTHVVLDIYYL